MEQDTTTLAEPNPPAQAEATHVVGIGASAGGLEALEQFFEKVPPHSGMAFVVVQHLSPDFRSLTDELLARRTPLPIRQVEDGMRVEPDAVYLIPPKKDMVIVNRTLLLTDKDPQQLPALPIDHFFRSLAQDLGDRAVAVVLSGTGSGGSRGIRDVHDLGGLVVAQAPESAKFDGMPRSAVQTGSVALTLPAGDIPDALVRHARAQLGLAPLTPTPAAAAEIAETEMETIFRLLRSAYDIDFSHYKPETILRRTDRRLLLNQSMNLEEYAQRLEEDPEELNRLYKDLLIGVTRFFRDKDAFERLESEVLPSLISRAGREEELRLWVAGCATGEEAYSLAILVHEAFRAAGRPMTAKILATDVHRASLDVASAGVYSAAGLADVKPKWLERYFVRKGDSYQVSGELRRTVVFAEHNVIKDAPFTRLDLIACRNLLIYFQPAAQKKVLLLFHFGLKPGGILFLGPSESPGDLGEEFDTVDRRWKMYRKRRNTRLPSDMRLPPAGPYVIRAAGAAAALPAPTDGQLLPCYDVLLDEYMPPSLLINEQRQVVHAFRGAGSFLQVRNGRVSTDVLDLVDPALRPALTGSIQRALRDHLPAAYKGLRLPGPAGERLMNLTVKPVTPPRSAAQYALLSLEEVDAPPPPADTRAAEALDQSEASREHVLALESELRYTRENLQATVEELETSNEELQASNEELVAANEELQSTNEELHSVNEELYTVNAEYQKKIAELTELTADMENLLTSTEVHTIFLDRELRVRKYTPRMAETFNLLPQDVGRRIDTFAHSINHPDLLDELNRAVRQGERFEKQVQDQRGAWYLLRIIPYRATERFEGVVLTLVDISRLKEAEEALRLKTQQLTSILRNSPNLIFMKDLEGRYTLADQSYRKIFGDLPLGKTAHDVFPKETADLIAARDWQVVSEGVDVKTEFTVAQADGLHHYLEVKFPVRDEQGRIVGISGTSTDVTQLKKVEQEAREAVVQRDRFLAMLSHELRNPLAAIVNAASMVDDMCPGPVVAEWIKVIGRRAEHTARLLDDLLDVSRFTQNKIEVRRRPIDLAALIDDVLEEVQPILDERRQTCTVQRPESPLPVDGDPDRLQQIQVNLLMNAAKYTGLGGRITFALAREGDEAVIRVRDTGIGLTPEVKERMFELFVQGDKPLDRASGGIGVGLTLVRSIVELHGGRVQAFSDGPGRGSELVVWLPLTTKPVVPVHEPPPPEHDGALVLPGVFEVLVVEDDSDIRASMRAILEHEGYRVRTAEDGVAAVAAIRQTTPDIALVDIGLPGMDGYEVARRVRQELGNTELRMVAITGYGQASDRQAAAAAGFDAHLTKPLKPRDLLHLLRILLGRGQPATR